MTLISQQLTSGKTACDVQVGATQTSVTPASEVALLLGTLKDLSIVEERGCRINNLCNVPFFCCFVCNSWLIEGETRIRNDGSATKQPVDWTYFR